MRLSARLPGKERFVGRTLMPWVLVLLVMAATPVKAQLMHLDPLPFFTPADSTSRLALIVDVDRFTDTKFDWNLNRVLLTTILPAGDDATFFLRISHLTFDVGTTSLKSRWPWVLGSGAREGWPHSQRISGFGKLEVGVTGPLVLPLLRGADYGLALGLPTGTDDPYPFTARSMPFRIQLRKPVVLGGGLQAGLLAGYLVHMDSGGDNLDPLAFPSGYQLGASLARFGGRGARWRLAWDYRNEDFRRSQIVSVQGYLPWAADGAVGLKIGRELQGSLDRAAEWYFSLSWRLDSPKYRQGLEVKPTTTP